MNSILQQFEHNAEDELERLVGITRESQKDMFQKADDLYFEVMMRSDHGIDEDLYQRIQVCERKFLGYANLRTLLREEEEANSPRKRTRSQPRISPRKVTFKDDE